MHCGRPVIYWFSTHYAYCCMRTCFPVYLSSLTHSPARTEGMPNGRVYETVDGGFKDGSQCLRRCHAQNTPDRKHRRPGNGVKDQQRVQELNLPHSEVLDEARAYKVTQSETIHRLAYLEQAAHAGIVYICTSHRSKLCSNIPYISHEYRTYALYGVNVVATVYIVLITQKRQVRT